MTCGTETLVRFYVTGRVDKMDLGVVLNLHAGFLADKLCTFGLLSGLRANLDTAQVYAAIACSIVIFTAMRSGRSVSAIVVVP